MRFFPLSCLVWMVIGGVLRAEPASSLPMLYKNGGMLSVGYAVKVGARTIGVTGSTHQASAKPEWTTLGRAQNWTMDAVKVLRPFEVSYFTFLENAVPVPVAAYAPTFSLTDGETLMLHHKNGTTLQGSFKMQHYKDSNYSTDQGFRLLVVYLSQAVNWSDFVAVTKADGRQVVGTVVDAAFRREYRNRRRPKMVVFEPLLVGHPVFTARPPTKEVKIFGRRVSPMAANTLAKWISPDFFPLQSGDAGLQWIGKWRSEPVQGFFEFTGGDMRQRFDSMTLNIDRPGDQIVSAWLGSGCIPPPEREGSEFITDLTMALGEPAEARHFKSSAGEHVVLRYRMSSSTDFFVKLSGNGPAGAMVVPAGASYQYAEPEAHATVTILPTAQKEVLKAVLSLPPH